GAVVSADNRSLYVVNAKGMGEDVQVADLQTGRTATGMKTVSDSNFLFGTAQRVDLGRVRPDKRGVLGLNFELHDRTDTAVVPAGGERSRRIRHVFCILQENKTFDSMLGADPRFGRFASLEYRQPDGSLVKNAQYTGVARNT